MVLLDHYQELQIVLDILYNDSIFAISFPIKWIVAWCYISRSSASGWNNSLLLSSYIKVYKCLNQITKEQVQNIKLIED